MEQLRLTNQTEQQIFKLLAFKTDNKINNNKVFVKCKILSIDYFMHTHTHTCIYQTRNMSHSREPVSN